MPPSTKAQIRGIATELAGQRSRFREVFDLVRVEQGVETDEFKVLAIGLDGPAALVAALDAAAADNWLKPLLQALVASGLDTEPADAADAAGGGDTPTAPTDLQRMVHGVLGFGKVAEISQAMLRFTRQICRVDIDGEPVGTGFLVGPHVVLTAWHVVADLLDEAGPTKGSAKLLRLVFDDVGGTTPSVIHTPVDDWLFAHQPCLDSERTDAPERLEAVTDDLSEARDYAVVELSSCPGYERGWVDLREAQELPLGGLLGCTVLQHPSGQPQRFASGQIEGLREKSGGTRMLHTANTDKGSSGGLVVDHRFRVVALHQGEVIGRKVNTGIVARSIVDHIDSLGRLAALAEPAAGRAQLHRRTGNTGPIIGRDEGQRHINKLRAGNAQRILMVSSIAPRMGKSFTVELMRACLPSTLHTFGLLNVKHFPNDALGAAATVLKALGLPADHLPDASSVDSGSDTWIKALVAELADRLAAGPGGTTRWLVLDGLERPLSDGGGRRFLSQLYAELAAMPSLRIVLIGLRTTLDGIDPQLIATEDVAAPTNADLQRYVQMAYVQRQINFSLDEARRMARLAVLTGGAEIVGLERFVRETLDRMIADETSNV